jgi:hypothetical protein
MKNNDINNIVEFLKMLITCEANPGNCITIPKSTALDIIEYITLKEEIDRRKS